MTVKMRKIDYEMGPEFYSCHIQVLNAQLEAMTTFAMVGVGDEPSREDSPFSPKEWHDYLWVEIGILQEIKENLLKLNSCLYKLKHGKEPEEHKS